MPTMPLTTAFIARPASAFLFCLLAVTIQSFSADSFQPQPPSRQRQRHHHHQLHRENHHAQQELHDWASRRTAARRTGPEPRAAACSRRRAILGTAPAMMMSSVTTLSLLLLSPLPSSKGIAAHAAETIGKEEDCNDRNCLGVWDGLLADCPHSKIRPGTAAAGCASSQDDTPGVFAEPWDYSEADDLDWQVQQDRLLQAVERTCARRGDSWKLLFRQGRYARVVFVDGATAEPSTGEFYFTPQDTTVQFRINSDSSITASTKGAKGTGSASSKLLSSFFSLSNMNRAELLRKELGYLKLPVLRNRQRALFFGESDLDSFGPGSAALGPPAEMRPGELEAAPWTRPRSQTQN